MKHFILLSLAAFFATSLCFSQNADKLKEQLEEVMLECNNLKFDNKRLQTDLLVREKEYDKLKSAYDKLKSTYYNLNSAHDSLKSIVKRLNVENLQKEFNKQKEELEELKKLYVLICKKYEEQKKYSEYLLKDSIHSLHNEHDSLKKKLAFEHHKTIAKDELIERLKKNETVLSKQLRIITDSLNNVCYEKPAGVSMDGENIEEYIAAVIANSEVALNSPYDDTLIQSLLPKLQSLHDIEQKKERKNELINITSQLGNYKVYLGLFQELKIEIDEIVKQIGREHKLVYPLVKGVIKKYKENGTIADICKIPYLQKQLKNYFDALDKDCTKEYRLELRKIEN